MNGRIRSSKGSDGIVEKIFWDFFFVMLLSSLSGIVSKVVDGLMVSHFLGEEMFAAQCLLSPFFTLMAVVNGLLATGAQIFISKCVVKGQFREADNVFSVSAIGGFTLAAAVTLVCFFFDDTIAKGFNIDTGNTHIYAATCDYLRGLSLGSIPLTLNSLMRTAITINGDRKRVKYTTTIVTVANAILNAVAILVLDMGMFGVGLATSISQWIGLMIYLLHFTKRKIICRFCFRHMRFGLLRDVLVRGSSRATVRVCNTLRPLLVNSWLLMLSTSAAVSAMGVSNSIRDVLLIPTTAISLTLMLIAQTFYAEQDKQSLHRLVQVALTNSLRIALVMSTLMLLFAPLIASIYLKSGTQAHAMACECLRWTAAGMLFCVINEFFLSFLLATDRHKSVHLLVIFEKLVYAVLWAWVLGLLFGVRGVFASFCAAEVCCTLHFLAMIWRKNRRFPAGLDQLMMLPKGFEIDPQRALEVSISSMDAAIGVSKRVMDFCLDKGVDHRRAFFAALCVEEMATNIIKHGFAPGKTQGLLIRILYVNDDLILRFRDSCRQFDIREKYESSDKRDTTKNIGIKLVMKISKDVLYLNTLNVNTTIIKI